MGLWCFQSVLVPVQAFAHGLSGGSDRSVLGFIGLGTEHMLLGWDHIMFIAAVLLLASDARRAAKLITAFVVGHSLTFITATLAGWQVDPTAVDVVIVLSVVVVAGWGMVGRPRTWGLFTAVVFAFGLVHGLGLATRFQALGVEDGVLWRVIAFNVGIEIGQLTAIVGLIALAVAVAMVLGEHRRSPETREAARAGAAKAVFAGLFLIGSVAAPLVAYQGFSRVDGDVSDVASPADSGCAIGVRTESFPTAGGQHSEKVFYAPGEQVPMENFGHPWATGTSSCCTRHRCSPPNSSSCAQSSARPMEPFSRARTLTPESPS